MSLINEALKKAQRQRTLDSAPLAGAPTGVAAAAVTTHVRAASHRRSYAPVWFGLGLLVLGVVSTVLVMRYGFPADPAPTAAAPTPVVVAATAPAPDLAPAPIAITTPAPQPVAPAPQSPAAATPEPAITFTLPPAAPAVATTPAPATAPAPAPTPVAVATPTPTPAPTPAPAPVRVAPVVAAPTAAEREAKIYAFLSAIRLTGVRGLDREARVLMNEKVYRLNDTVDADLGLRLSGVRPGLLLFTDSTGRVYEKRL